MRLRTRKSDVPEGAMVPRPPQCVHAVARVQSAYDASFGAAFWRPLCMAARGNRAMMRLPCRSGRSAHWVKVKNPAGAPAVKT
jgi:hypothetical protein